MKNLEHTFTTSHHERYTWSHQVIKLFGPDWLKLLKFSLAEFCCSTSTIILLYLVYLCVNINWCDAELDKRRLFNVVLFWLVST